MIGWRFFYHGQRWTVSLEEQPRLEAIMGSPCYAGIDMRARRIYLGRDFSPEVIEESLLHEMLHLFQPQAAEQTIETQERLLRKCREKLHQTLEQHQESQTRAAGPVRGRPEKR